MNAQSDESEIVRRLFLAQVPEAAAGVVEFRGIVREPGQRSIVTVASKDPAVDAVGACVGHRGSRIKQIITELAGEKIDIVRWSDSVKEFISNLLAPMKVVGVTFQELTHEAVVVLARGGMGSAPEHQELQETFRREFHELLEIRARMVRELTGWNLKVEFSEA